MADLLGSLLPSGYSAPNVQSILGGNLLLAVCVQVGSVPMERCIPGSAPAVACEEGIDPGGGGGEPAYCTPYGQSPPTDPGACTPVGYAP